MSDPLLIRASSTSSYPDCQRRGAARLMPGVLAELGYKMNQRASPVGASIGTATHAAVAHTMGHKAQTGVLANETETEQRGLASLSEEIGKGVRFDGISPNLNTAQKQVIRQYRSYKIHLADRINPRAVEHRITMRSRNGNDISGAMDLNDDGIHDLKTGVAQRVNIAQYGTYSLLERFETGVAAAHLTEDFVRRVSIDKEQPAPVQISYDRQFAEEVAVSIISDMEQRAKLFLENQDQLLFLANPASQLCSDRYCPAFRTNWCPESYGKGVADEVLL